MHKLIRKVFGLSLLTALTCGLSLAAPNQFVIVSDLHPTHAIMNQMERLTKEVLEVHPAFVIQLGDVGNDSFPGGSVWQMKVIDDMFRKWREAGIEIHIAVGNHDVPAKMPGVAALKRNWFASQLPPYPMNSQLDAEKNPDVWKRYCLEGQHYYSFTWRGIHFVIADTETLGEEQLAWWERVLCDHEGNPSKYPTLMFLHHPEHMSGDREVESRPLYQVLKKNPEGHTVKAVFGGHYHYGHYWPPEDNLGTHVYACPASVLNNAIHHPNTPAYTEFIIATVTEKEIAFEKRTINPPGGRTANSEVVFHPVLTDLVYHPIPGKFGDLD